MRTVLPKSEETHLKWTNILKVYKLLNIDWILWIFFTSCLDAVGPSFMKSFYKHLTIKYCHIKRGTLPRVKRRNFREDFEEATGNS